MAKIRNKRRLKIGVIFGGRSGEHEVSIVSAKSVMDALDRTKYDVVPIGITKFGSWIAGPKAIDFLKEGLKKLPFKSVLQADPSDTRLVNVKGADLVPLRGTEKKLDVIFPLIHGTFGEDGSLQGFLELANLPYVGAGVLGSAVGMDKIIQKQLFKQHQLPIVAYEWFLASEWSTKRAAIVKRLEKRLAYPMFTKPANAGSSVGIGKCHNRQELILGIKNASLYDRKILVEQGIERIHEIEVAVLGNNQPKASVPGEIIASNEFYDYDAKYVDGKSQAIIPAKLPAPILGDIQQLALGAFRALDLAGMARVDFLVKQGSHHIYLNEVNTIPGFTAISMYPKLWQASGLSYRALLDELIRLAIERHNQKNRLATSYQPKAEWYK